MAARKRITLSLQDEVYLPFKELAEEINIPAATLIANLLLESVPKVKATTNAIRLAKSGSLVALDKLDELADSVAQDTAKVKDENAKLRKSKQDVGKKPKQ